MMNILTNNILQKSVILVFLLNFLFLSSFSQNDSIHSYLLNKKGQRIIPEAGSIAGGIDVLPFLNYLGNFSNNTQNNTYKGVNFLGEEQRLLIKYFIKENTAFRARVGFENFKNEDMKYVRDDYAFFQDALSEKQVTDIQTSQLNSSFIALGVEKNRTNGRLRGIVGIELFYAFEKLVDTYTYGNPFSSLNSSPVSYDFGSNVNGNFRLLKDDFGKRYTAGINLIFATEYFILPNICLGAELNFGGLYSAQTQSYRKEEYLSGVNVQTINRLSSPGGSLANFSMLNPTSGLYLMMHF